MKRYIALSVCGLGVIFALWARQHDGKTWGWAIGIAAAPILFCGIWLGKVNLHRSQSQMVNDELAGRNALDALPKMMITTAIGMTVLSTVMMFL